MNTTVPGGSLTLLGVFLAGLSLNLTPCVYPMLSITLSLFGTKKEATSLKAFFKALVYVLGMITMYTVLGVAAARTGGFFGALLQHKAVLVGIAVFMLVLALGMLGKYTFQLPSRMVNHAASRRGVGFIGVYFSGLFAGVIAAPCIGPPIIALLAFVGSRGEVFSAFWIFFVLALGLGFPYLILGTFSGLLHKLPRSGVWLVWTERLFGVVLVGLAAFYLIIAFNPSLIRWLAPVMLVAGGTYLGFAGHGANYKGNFQKIRKGIGVAAILIGIALPIFYPREGVVWDSYSASKLEEAQRAGKKVVMDFYADWCIPCHELDRYTYTDAKVIESLSPFVRLKVDMTQPDKSGTIDAAERFDIIGVPTIVFLNEQGKEISKARLTGFVPPKEFLEALERMK